MKITIMGRKCSPRESFKEHAEKKLAKVERFFGEDTEAKVIASVEKSSQTVEITIVNQGMIFRAQERAENMNEALDKCVDSLIRQIRKNKTKIEKKLRNGSIDDLLPPAEISEPEEDLDVVRIKTVSLKPQSEEEAILQMNLLDHEFYVFLNDASNSVNVVYKRSDGGYGLIKPEF
ncbi:MAG: ribosome-associated translation inhibitor RaiA [Clostridia bacterium]|nr:ribosome-associated translation inhibitor RaiA [Clostridia bacterium]MBQ4243834.1 ribosome-associated translation inhibitor RaiA [Clostridia bacterium]